MSNNSVKSNQHIYYAHNGEVKNQKGFLWRGWVEEIIVPAGGHYYISVAVDAIPIRLNQIFFATDAVKSHLDLYEGGVISGGTPVLYESMNLDNRNPIANLVSLQGITVNTAGALIVPVLIRGSSNVLGGVEISRGDDDAGVILGRNQLYYIDIWNEDTQSRNFDFYFNAQVRVEAP